MKGIFHWLSMNLPNRPASKLGRGQDDSENDERSPDGDFQANIDDLMPDIYGQPTGDTVPLLKIIKDESHSADRSEGFDPYNTGSFEVSKK